MPEGYKTIAVKENRDLSYSFAIINSNSTMEIRYSIWSLKASIKSYEESLKDSNSIMVHPNKHYKGRIQANVLNMTGGQMYDIGSFPPQAVKRSLMLTMEVLAFLNLIVNLERDINTDNLFTYIKMM